jgi:hypothetical protein
VIFPKEHSTYGVAFGSEHLGLIREYYRGRCRVEWGKLASSSVEEVLE